MAIPFTPKEFWHLWFNIPIHGVFAILGAVLAMLIIIGNARKQRIFPTIILAEAFFGFVTAWLLSKLFYYLGPYGSCGSCGISDILGRGFVFYGGLIGGTAAVYVYTNLKGYEFWKHADIWALGISLGLFVARIGCFIVNDAPGKITNLAWALRLPDSTTVHPAALYLSLFNLFLFAYLYSKKLSKRFHGQIFLQYLMIYSAGRFLIEFLRDYQFHYLSLTFSQWISIMVFACSLAIYIKRSRRV